MGTIYIPILVHLAISRRVEDGFAKRAIKATWNI